MRNSSRNGAELHISCSPFHDTVHITNADDGTHTIRNTDLGADSINNTPLPHIHLNGVDSSKNLSRGNLYVRQKAYHQRTHSLGKIQINHK